VEEVGQPGAWGSDSGQATDRVALAEAPTRGDAVCQARVVGIFRRTTGRRTQSSLPTSGHPGDDELLAHIASSSDIEQPRHWVHYLYVSDEPQARSAAEVIGSAGWEIQRVDVSADGGPEWVVVAESHRVTTPHAVREARLFFEGVAATHVGGDYDGWEASL
jgi:hypothetical protein